MAKKKYRVYCTHCKKNIGEEYDTKGKADAAANTHMAANLGHSASAV